MTSMEERYTAIQEDACREFNGLPIEERKRICKYTSEQQMLTLYQVLHKHEELTTTAWRAKIRDWLHNCIRLYEQIYNTDEFQPYQIKTNADSIRAMSDEELADWLKDLRYSWTCVPRQNGNRCAVFNDDCLACWLDWLQSLVDGGDAT